MPHRVFSIEEVASYLHLDEDDVRTLVRDGDIPFETRGNRPVFRPAEIDAWASHRILGMEGDRVAAYHSRTHPSAPTAPTRASELSALVHSSCIAPALSSRTKASVLRDLVAVAEQTGLLHDSKALIDSLIERETLCSTGLPGGLAIPHPRHHHPWLFERSFLIIGRTLQAVQFGSPDHKPTDLFFLLCCQDDRLHLRSLARICMLAQKTPLLENLRTAESASEMIEVLLAAERTALDAPPSSKRLKGKPL